MIRTLFLACALLAATVTGAAGRIEQVMNSDDIGERIEREIALRARLAPGARLELDNKALRFPASPETLVVENLSFDQRSGRVSAYVANSADDSAERLHITGRMRYLVELPVLNRYIAPGEIITARDIERVEFRSDRINQAVAAEESELIGRTPRRAVRPQEPVRQADIMLPLMVRKGDLVTVVLQTPALRLTAQGKATDDGAQGAVIRVANSKSGRMLDATVVGPGAAIIGGPGAPAPAIR
jgi:flagella basal body P-ring formation protein FlgA